eukprot:1850453-Prymnesium_polylepis.1
MLVNREKYALATSLVASGHTETHGTAGIISALGRLSAGRETTETRRVGHPTPTARRERGEGRAAGAAPTGPTPSRQRRRRDAGGVRKIGCIVAQRR